MSTTQKPKLVHFAGHDCVVQVEQYASTGHTALSLYDAKKGEYVATATINLPDIPLSPNQVFIKDYSENAGMLAALEKAGIIEVQGCYVPTGIGSLPVCNLLIEPPVQEKGGRGKAPEGRTGYADSRGELAKDMLAEARSKNKPKAKSRDFDMER